MVRNAVLLGALFAASTPLFCDAAEAGASGAVKPKPTGSTPPTPPSARQLAWQPPDEDPIVPTAPVPIAPRPAPQPQMPDDYAPDEPDEAPHVSNSVPDTANEATDEEGIETAARPQSERQVDQLLLDQGGVLLPAGKAQIEPSVDYTFVSSDRVNIAGFTVFNAIVIGTITVDDLSRDIVTSGLTTRLGVTNRLQVEGRLTGVYREDEELLSVGTSDESVATLDAIGLGDVQATVSWQPWAARGWRPAAILRGRATIPTGTSVFEIERVPVEPGSPVTTLARAPTGSGFFAANFGATFVWRSDPAVVFLGGSYTRAFERDFADFGRIDPGDTAEWFAGLNLSLNQRLSMNMSFVNQRTFTTRQNDVQLIGTSTNDARLTFGNSVGLAPWLSMVLTAQAGLTDESPDYAVSLNFPITFDIF